MSVAARQHIAEVDGEIDQLRARVEALKEIRDTIANDQSFTPDEQTRVSDALYACESDIRTKEEQRDRATSMLETTIAQCENDVSAREETLNDLFNREVLRNFQDMMSFFEEHHTMLKDTLSRPIDRDAF